MLENELKLVICKKMEKKIVTGYSVVAWQQPCSFCCPYHGKPSGTKI
jgi:hypothetical protein